MRPSIPRVLNCKSKVTKCSKDDCLKHKKDMHAIFIDDLSELEAIDLKKQLTLDPVVRSAPLNYHERTGMILPPNSILQKNLTKIETFAAENKMKVNAKKTNIMLFNTSKNYDFPPEFKLSDGEYLGVLSESRLLGVQIQTNLKWDSNTATIYKKAMKKMWLLRRMRNLGLENFTILDFYLKEIRPLTEHGVVAWNSGLTKAQIREIEKIQKVAFRIIFDNHFDSYESACKGLNLPTLQERRTTLCTSFAIKLFKSTRRDEFFTVLEPKSTRSKPKLVLEERSRTSRNFNAPHNYLNRLVNENSEKIMKSMS